MAKIAFAAGLLACGGSLRAQTITWNQGNHTGTGQTSDATDPSNWSGTLGPGVDVAFGLSVPPTVNLPSAIAVGNITFNDTDSPVRPAYTFTGSGPLTVNGNIVVNAGGDVDLTSGLPLTLSASTHTITIVSGPTLKIEGAVSGAGNIVKSGAGTLSLSGANTFTGTTTISGGTLVISADGNLGITPGSATTGSLTLNGGTLDAIAGFTLNSNRGISLGSSGGTLRVDAGTLTYAGLAAGTGVLTKTGAGSLLLSGSNSFSGGVTLSAGTLVIGNANAIGTGALTIAGSTTLDSSSALTLTHNNAEKWNGDFTFAGSNNLNLGTGAVTLSGTNFTNRIVTVSASTLTVGGVIDDGGSTLGLTKNGTGTLLLTGANGYDGGTTINAGTLQLGNGGTTGSLSSTGNIVINSGGTLAINRNATTSNVTLTLPNAISGAGNLSLSLATANANLTDTVTLSGNNGNFTGPLTSGGNGTVSLANVNARGTGTWTLSDNATLDITASGTNISNVVTGVIRAGNTTFAGNASLLAQNSYAISGGNQTFSDAAVFTASAANVITGGNQTFTTATNPLGTTVSFVAAFTDPTLTYNGVTGDDAVGLLLKNTSRLTVDKVSSNNTITGGTQTFNGYSSLQANHSVAISGSSTQIFNDNSHLRASKTNAVAGGNQTFNGNSFLWAKTTDGGAAVSGGNQTFNDASSLVAATANAVIGGNQTFTASSSLTATITGAITGGNQTFTDSAGVYANATGSIVGVDLTLKNNSFVSVGAPNALDATTDIYFSGSAGGTGGTLSLNGHDTTVGEISSGNATNPAPGLIENNSSTAATFTVGDGTNTTFSGVIQDGTVPFQGEQIYGHSALFVAAPASLALVKEGTGHLYLTGSNTYTGGTTINAGYLDLGNNGLTGSITGNVTFTGTTNVDGGELQFYRSNAYTFTGNISGPGRVSNFAAGTTTLSGTNTYSGDTFVFTGAITDGTANAFSPNSVMRVNTGAALDVNHNESIAGLNDYTTGVSGSVVLGNGATVTSNDSANHTFTGVLSGTGNFTKSNPGTLTLAGDDTFTGTTKITGGVLALANSLALEKSTLDYNTYGGVISFGALGNVTFGGLSGGQNLSLQYSNDGFLPLALTVGANNQNTTYSGVLSDPGFHPGASLTKSGTGTLTLGGISTYTGTTTIQGGTLQLGIDNALSTSTDVNLSSGGTTLDLNGHRDTVGSIAGVANSTIITSGGLATVDNQSTTFSGNLTGFGSLGKSGSGTLTLNGTNTYNGGTVIFGGTLALGPAGSLNPGGDVTVSSDATFSVGNNQTTRLLGGSGTVAIGDGQTLTVNLPSSGTGSVGNFGGSLTGTSAATFAEVGAGLLTLSGDSHTFAGPISVGSGTLTVVNANALGATSAGTTVSNAGELIISGVAVGAESVTLSGNGAFGGGALVGLGTASLAGPVTLAANASVGAFASTDTLTLSGGIGESGGSHRLTKTGSGTVTLAGQSTYTGGTSITGGTLVVGVNNALPTSTQISLATGSALEVANDQTIAGFFGSTTGSTLLIDATKTLKVSIPTANTFTNYSGNIALGGTGTGTFAVTGATGGGDIAFLANAPGSGIATAHDGNSTIVIGNTPIPLPANGTLLFSGNTTQTLNNVISGTNATLVFTAGNTTFTASNTYSGPTAITGGSLIVNNAPGGSATGTGIVTVTGTGVFGGSGFITGQLVLGSGGTVSPGNSPGLLTVGPTTFAGSNTFAFDLNNATGAAGTNWDVLAITGGLTIAATSAAPVTINLVSLTASNTPGLAQNFNAASSYSWQFITTTTGITGFTSPAFTVNTSNFQNSLGTTGFFFVSQSGNNLLLNFSPVPEPSTWALLGLGLLFGVGRALHRQKR